MLSLNRFVGTVLYDEEGYLLQHRDSEDPDEPNKFAYPDHLGLIGGKIEPDDEGQTHTDMAWAAFERELAEELVGVGRTDHARFVGWQAVHAENKFGVVVRKSIAVISLEVTGMRPKLRADGPEGRQEGQDLVTVPYYDFAAVIAEHAYRGIPIIPGVTEAIQLAATQKWSYA